MDARPSSLALTSVVVLAALGAWWAVAAGAADHAVLLVAVAVVGIFAAFPVSRVLIVAALGSLQRRTRLFRSHFALGVWLLAVIYLIFTAFRQERDLIPLVHDEHSYLIQTRMLAAGRLWMPRHELAEFFESFHVLTEPVYASIYFPGAAVMYAPAVWLGQPTWALPAVAAALVVALTFLCVTELLDDGAWGLAASLVVLGVGLFRTHSMIAMAQMPAALLGVATVWAYLRWHGAGGSRWWAVAAGALAGWAAVTRPVDALAYAAPVGLAMLLDLRGRAAPARAYAAVAGAVVAGALPFLILQAVFNHGVTGSVLKTPYVFYLERYQPGSEFGLGGTAIPDAAPATTLPQKLAYYREFLPTNLRGHPPERLGMTGGAALPTPLLLPLVAVGLYGMTRDRRWVLGAAAPLFFLLYLLNPYYLGHYTVPMAPSLALLVAAGGKALEEVVATRRSGSGDRQRFAAAFLVPAVAALSVGRLPEFDSSVRDEWIALPTVRMARDVLPHAVEAPAVVLFTFRPGNNVHDEPVYNSDVAWPDAARIVKAHDLGVRNRAAIEYFARHQPQREFYRYDRGTDVLTPLGSATEWRADPAPALEVPAVQRGSPVPAPWKAATQPAQPQQQSPQPPAQGQ